MCLTFTLIINEVDLIIRDLEAVTGGDVYVQSICVLLMGDVPHEKRTQMTNAVAKVC